MKNLYRLSIQKTALLGLLLGLALGMRGQNVTFDLWKNAAGTGGRVNNYPVWIKYGAPLNHTSAGYTDGTGRFTDSLPNLTGGVPVQFITYDCTGNRIVSSKTLTTSMSSPGDTLVVSCSSPKPGLSASISFTQHPVFPLQFSFNGSFSETALPSGLNYSFDWNFGDGFTATGSQNVNHTFINPFSYQISFTVSVFDSIYGNLIFAKTSYTNVSAMAPLVCNTSFRFRADGGNGIQFIGTASSTGFPRTSYFLYDWDFGDGTKDTAQHPEHVFPAAGNYYTCFTTYGIDTIGDTLCSQSYCDTVEAGFPLTTSGNGCSSFFVSQPDSLNPYHYNFMDSSSANGGLGTLNGKSWMVVENGKKSFLNVSNYSQALPAINHNYTFSGPGTFYVYLYSHVKDSLSGNYLCASKYVDTIVISSTPLPGCNADFQFSNIPSSPAFTFTDSSSTNPGAGGSVRYGWSFGDGASDTTQNASHAYAATGTYNVCHWVVVRNAQNTLVCTDTVCKTVNYGNVPTSCALSILSLPNGGNSLQFNPYVSSSVQVNSWAFSWSFGDNTTSNLRRPIHSYSSAGTYEVCVVAYALDSLQDTLCTATICDSVFAGFPINTTCQAKLGIALNPNPFHFTFIDSSLIPTTPNQRGHTYIIVHNVSTGKSAFIQGGFGAIFPGHFSGGLDLDSGVYNVCLYDVVSDTTTGQIVCVARDCRTISVPMSKSCEASYIVDTVNSFFGTVYIWNDSKPEYFNASYTTSYFWDFGDGTTSNQPYPVHPYATPGVYPVCLTINTANLQGDTCSDTFCDTLGVDSLGRLIYKNTTTQFILKVLNPETIGLAEQVAGETLSVYPNPATERVTLEWGYDLRKPLNWKINDLKGATLLTGAEEVEGRRKTEIDVSQLRAGVYILTTYSSEYTVAHYKLRIN